jgi:hypothetical protein
MSNRSFIVVGEMLQDQRVVHNDQFITRILGEDGHVSHDASISFSYACKLAGAALWM